MMPGKNGERRLVRNLFTRKMVWTRGVEPSSTKTNKVDFSKEKSVYVDNPSYDKKTNFLHVSNLISYEPLKINRFVVNFSDIEPYFIQSYCFLGKSKKENLSDKDKFMSHISMILPLSPVLALEDKLLSLKGKNIGRVTISLLDATGVEVRIIALDDVVVEQVEMLNSLDYSKDEILKAHVNISHSDRKFLKPLSVS